MNSIQRVLIVGGVHGNEFTGIYVVKKLENHPYLIQRDNFETLTFLANPKAFAAVRRYIDQDLNRSFKKSDLQDLTRSSYEDIRAREINNLFGANGKTPVDVILDLHSSTANMGLTLMTDDRSFNLQLVTYLQSLNPSINIYLSRKSEEYFGLPSICELGCTIEVGAVPQGVLQADFFRKTEALVINALNYFEQYNRGEIPSFDKSLTVYRHIGTIDYPRNESGELQAMIHPQLQFQDYQPLAPGEPIFLTFDGETITYQGESTVYPVFINEAAYYEKGIAMCLTQKEIIHNFY
ncbi:aspartoacylase [Aetokthonos hydrillicola Thurmond2011]|uniref:Probable aspartoacylase n=1 Tax=Aetokthonos hydrillicola Thurmond2011 TaxID=2712845 RepID=A0AAP5I9N0_9CYAN|nr:aspartoacylase [Aetokthonos hydrillicola]MBO3461064.1 aspartoacylase [Aetokthonos hydrillicola CCALA 1050]MBW4586317.1 aspartoacylase [Aetokthonos hydrillicola CCALA 1050]MDR9897445.1 aspartoacylase [Aetokthonos hydrillicola Thurmond2011]